MTLNCLKIASVLLVLLLKEFARLVTAIQIRKFLSTKELDSMIAWQYWCLCCISLGMAWWQCACILMYKYIIILEIQIHICVVLFCTSSPSWCSIKHMIFFVPLCSLIICHCLICFDVYKKDHKISIWKQYARENLFEILVESWAKIEYMDC